VRIGIIGYGQIGRTHRAAIESLPDASVVAVSRRAHVDEPGIDWHADYRELVRRDDIDLVVICTPSGLHAGQAIDALDAGKGVVIEKPIALSVDDGRRVVELARREQRFLSVISQRRTEDAVQALHRALADGRMGRPVLGETLVRWSRDQRYYDSAGWRGTLAMDGGVLMNQAIHAIDLLCWLFGPVESVQGATATLVRRIEAEDTAVASLRFANGAVGSITATTAIAPGMPAEVNLFCELGSVSLHDAEVARWDVPGVPVPALQELPGSGSTDPAAIGDLGHRRQWHNIIAAFRSGEAPLVSGEDGLATIAVIAAIEESSRTGQAVRPAFVKTGDRGGWE
jgi:predicted dehydrogenase